MKTIQIEKLSQESFAPFGRVLSTAGREHESTPGSHDWYPGQGSVDGADSVSVNMLVVKERPVFSQKFEKHGRTTESLIPLTSGVVISCIAPGPVSVDRVHAFYVPVGMGVCFDVGVWHFVPHPVGGDATCLVVFRNGTSEDDMTYDALPEPVKFVL